MGGEWRGRKQPGDVAARGGRPRTGQANDRGGSEEDGMNERGGGEGSQPSNGTNDRRGVARTGGGTNLQCDVREVAERCEGVCSVV